MGTTTNYGWTYPEPGGFANTWGAVQNTLFQAIDTGLYAIRGGVGTLTTSAPGSVTQTWNAGGVTFTGFKVDITNTASAAGSLFADFRIGGASKWSVDKAGNVTAAGSMAAATGFAVTGNGHSLPGANRFLIDNLAGVSRIYAYGPDAATAGSFELHCLASDGEPDTTVITANSSSVVVTPAITASGGVVGALTGNASTATALATARAINGTNFDGTAAITVTAAAGTLTGGTLNATVTASSLTSLGTIAALSAGTIAASSTAAIAAGMSVQGPITVASGSGLEFEGGAAPNILSYNRTGGAYLDMQLRGLTITIKPGDVTRGVFSSTGLAITGAGSATTGFTTSGGAIYPGGDLGFTSMTADAQSGVYTTTTGSPNMLFDHRGTGNAGLWTWRNASGAGTTVMTLSATGALSPIGRIDAPSYTVGTLPAVGSAGGIIYVSNEAGGAVQAFSDGSNWRRVTDRAVVS